MKSRSPVKIRHRLLLRNDEMEDLGQYEVRRSLDIDLAGGLDGNLGESLILNLRGSCCFVRNVEVVVAGRGYWCSF